MQEQTVDFKELVGFAIPGQLFQELDKIAKQIDERGAGKNYSKTDRKKLVKEHGIENDPSIQYFIDGNESIGMHGLLSKVYKAFNKSATKGEELTTDGFSEGVLLVDKNDAIFVQMLYDEVQKGYENLANLENDNKVEQEKNKEINTLQTKFDNFKKQVNNPRSNPSILSGAIDSLKDYVKIDENLPKAALELQGNSALNVTLNKISTLIANSRKKETDKNMKFGAKGFTEELTKLTTELEKAVNEKVKQIEGRPYEHVEAPQIGQLNIGIGVQVVVFKDDLELLKDVEFEQEILCEKADEEVVKEQFETRKAQSKKIDTLFAQGAVARFNEYDNKEKMNAIKTIYETFPNGISEEFKMQILTGIKNDREQKLNEEVINTYNLQDLKEQEVEMMQSGATQRFNQALENDKNTLDEIEKYANAYSEMLEFDEKEITFDDIKSNIEFDEIPDISEYQEKEEELNWEEIPNIQGFEEVDNLEKPEPKKFGQESNLGKLLLNKDPIQVVRILERSTLSGTNESFQLKEGDIKKFASGYNEDVTNKIIEVGELLGKRENMTAWESIKEFFSALFSARLNPNLDPIIKELNQVKTMDFAEVKFESEKSKAIGKFAKQISKEKEQSQDTDISRDF